MISLEGLRQRATIRRGATVVDGVSGRRTLDWTGDAIASGVPCSVQPAKRSAMWSPAGLQQIVATHRMFANLPLDLRVGDRIEVAGGEAFVVRKVDEAAGRGHHLEADLDLDKGRGETPPEPGS